MGLFRKKIKSLNQSSKPKNTNSNKAIKTVERKVNSNKIVKTNVSKTNSKAPKHTGEVYWANNTKIDPSDTKTRRQFAVVNDNGKNVGIAKIRGINNNSKNDERLYKLDEKKYPLTKPSGVDKKVYTNRADNQRPLRLNDKQVFDSKPSFKLSSHDTHRIINHTNKKRKRKV